VKDINFVYHDFEFTKISEPELRLVSCAVLDKEGHKDFWLDQDRPNRIPGPRDLRAYYNGLPPGTVLVAFNAEAEARSMMDLGVDPLKFDWICLYLETVMCMNHDNSIAYGEHYVDGKVKNLRPFEDAKPRPSLATALYKFLKVKIDTAHKDEMRSLIISDPLEFSPSERDSILKYGASDVEHLPRLREAVWDFYRKKLRKPDFDRLLEDSKRRARYAVRTAAMVRRGYPINVEWARNLSGSIPEILDACIRDVNGQFPNHRPFRWDKSSFKWVMDTKTIRRWIADQNFTNWPLTDGGKSGKKELSLAEDAWSDRFNYRHDYPRGNFGAQILRYLRLKQSLNGYANKAGMEKKTFWDYVGSDGRVRPYYNIFWAQSSRSQPPATGYVHLKPAWQRSIVQPPKGKMIAGGDYASQEFLVAGLMTPGTDRKMIQAYASGDVYLAYGKEIGVIPKDGTKKTHGPQRDQQKPVILGWQFGMTGVGLSINLTAQTGRKWYEEEAQDLLNQLDETYYDYSQFRKETVYQYRSDGYLQLRDGWTMFGDNRNDRSVQNVKVQGAGADVMRRAVDLCEDEGLPVIMTLHDALYVELDVNDWEGVKKFRDCMTKAFISYFPENPKDASLIRVDLKAWGQGIEKTDVCSTSEIFIDERAVKEYDKFSPFFNSVPGHEIL
jgi:hypothetical protein